jgi:hypothetical protein
MVRCNEKRREALRIVAAKKGGEKIKKKKLMLPRSRNFSGPQT